MQHLGYILPRCTRVLRYLSTQSAYIPQNHQFFWATIQSKLNKSTIEEILQPMIDDRNIHNKTMPSLFYDVLIDLCKVDREIDSVLSDMITYQSNCFSIQRLLKIPNAKLEKMLRLLMENYDCNSLLQAIQTLIQPEYHILLGIILDYSNGKIDFEMLSRKCFTVSIRFFDILSLLLKLENFDKFATDFKDKLLSDDSVHSFALNQKCSDALRIFILEQHISTYQNSNIDIGFHDKILLILNFIEAKNERQSSQIKRPLNSFDYKVLADLYGACLSKNNVELATYAFSISHHLPLTGHYNDRTRYYTNLLHQQSVLKIRQSASTNKKISKKNKIKDMNSILIHDLINDLTSMYYFPSPHLFISQMHNQIANNVDPFDNNIFSQFITTISIKKGEEIRENLTKWTEYYTKYDALSINTYCNMLYIILNFSHQLKIPLTIKQVSDVLQRLKPVPTVLEKEKKQYLKAIKYFDSRVNIPFEGTQCPVEIHNLILFAYSRMNLFSEMKSKYLTMCTKDNQVDTHTYYLLIESAIKEGIGDQCRFIFEHLWKDVLTYQSLGKSIPNDILEGIVACMCICREHGKAIEFIKNAFKEERSLNATAFDAYISSCSLFSDLLALQDLRDILLEYKEKEYSEIINKCSLKIDEFESKQNP